MHDSQQISPTGLSGLLFGFLVGSTLVLPVGVQAKQDSWLAILLGGGAGMVVAWVYTSLASRFPGQTLIGYSKTLLGQWLGGLVGLLYIWYGLHLGALVMRNFGEFLVTTILPTTPISVFILTLMLLCAYGVRHGLEPLARASQLMGAMLLIETVLASLLMFKDVRLENLLPVMEQGPIPVFRGAFALLGFPFGETVLFALILPFVRPASAVRRTVMKTMGVSAIFLAAINARNIALLGAHLSLTSRFPSLIAFGNIDIADFLTRLDALIVGAWIVTGFMKVTVCLYVTAAGLAEWARVPDYKPLVLPLGVIMAALSILVYDDVSAMGSFGNSIWPVYSIPFQILMPLLLLGLTQVYSPSGK